MQDLGAGSKFKKYQRHYKTVVRKMCILILTYFTYNFPAMNREKMSGFKLIDLSKIFFMLFDTSLRAVTLNVHKGL